MFDSLNVSLTGLRAAKIAVENVSNNIANENTPGYKRRVVQFGEIEQLDARFTGRGVSADEARRITNEYSQNNLIGESTKSSYYNQKSQLLGNIEAIFKETDTSGLSKDLDRYFKAMENYRSNPNSEVYKTDLVNQGSILVDSLNNMYGQIEKQQALIEQSLNEDVNKVDRILKDIGEVNKRLKEHKAPGNDLLDKRDQLEEELSKYVDIEVDRTPGEYSLSIGGVTAIRFNTNVRDIEIKKEETPQLDRFVKDDTFTSSILDGTTFDNQDEIVYKFNNEHQVSVKFGETVNFDMDGDGTPENVTVDASNHIRVLAYKINSDPVIGQQVQAFNGNYQTKDDGTKFDTRDKDKFLVIEAKKPGLDGKFEGRISIVEQTNASDPTTISNRKAVYKDEDQSKDAVERSYLSIYESEVKLNSGSIKAKIENVDSRNPMNKLQDYKDGLDAFAKTLADITGQYIKKGTDNYTYGEKAIDNSGSGNASVKELNLFTGSSVKTLSFNKEKVEELNQGDLEYLASIQWQKNLSFTDKGQDSSGKNVTSFKEFFQELKVSVSSDKENNDFFKNTQNNVVQSLQSNYDQLVKVDKDEEMLNLVKFQAAYTANAKIVSVVDEMLQTLLGLKR